MKQILIFSIIVVFVITNVLFGFSFVLNPKQAKAQAVPPSAHNVGEFAQSFDGGFGHPVYVLSDAALCPKGATHTYSYTREFSINGDMIFGCGIDPTNGNITRYMIYDSNFKLIYKDVVRDSGHTQFNQSDFADAQFSQKRRVVFAQRQMRIYEFDPWNVTQRVYADFAGTQFTIPAGQQYAGTYTANVARAPKIGPNDEIVIEMGVTQSTLNPSSTCPSCFEILGIGTFNPSTGQISSYSIRGDGRGPDHPAFEGPNTQGFDETNITQDGRVFSTYNVRPQWSFNLDFSNPVEFREPSFGQYGAANRQWSGHGHMGFFKGSNGKSYVVKVVNDLIDDDADGLVNRVGQVGTSVNGKWRALHQLANTLTGKIELVWGVNHLENGWGNQHYSRSRAPDVFWGSESAPGNITRYQVSYDASGNPNNVNGTNIAKSQSNLSCGYWAHPRVTSDDTGNRGLYDSTVAGGCTTQVYVAVNTAGGAPPPPPPPPVTDTTPPIVSLSAPTNGSTVSGLVTVSANASDNNGIAGVQFLLNGNNLGTEDTIAPYSVSWNTGVISNGSYTLSARARDFAGNQTTAGSISVSVNNITLPAPADGTLLLYTTFDNSASITSPQIGSGIGASLAGTPTFIAGQSGSAMTIDADQEYARFQQIAGTIQNTELTKGTIEFWYKPNYNHNDGLRHNIFSIGSFGSPGAITLVKGVGGEIGLFYSDSSGQIREASEYSSTNYSWVSGQWIKIRATWDFTVSSGTQNTRIYLNDAEKTYRNITTGSVSMPAESSTQYIYIGNRSPTDNNNSNGSFDELRIWSGTIAPGSTTPPPPPPPSGDTTPPTISNVSSTNIQTNSAAIVWSTNEPADTQVEYGTTTSLGQSTTIDATPLTSHVVTISSLSSGTTYYYRVKSKDTAGNLATSAIFNFVTQTSQPPTLSVILTGTPITGTVPLITSLTADVSGSATGPINYTFYCNRSDTGTNITSGYDYKFDGTNEDPKIVPNACTYSTPGTYTAKVITERSNASSVEARITIFVSSPTDTTPPVVSITSPLAGQSVSSVIIVSANASDNVGVAGVQFLLNGGVLGIEDPTSPYSISWDTTQAANGTHILSARARDNGGNQTVSAGVNVNVSNVSAPPPPPPPPSDTAAPSVSITSPTNGATVSGTTNLSANASDNVGVAGVQFKLNGVNLGAEDTVAPYSLSWNTIDASNGTHVLTAVARDVAGNQTISSSITITVNNTTTPPPPPPPGDTSAPTISGIIVSNITTKSADVSWITNEPADSVVRYGLGTSLGATQSASTLVTTHAIKLSGLSRNSAYSYQISSADASGNRAQSNILTFTTLSKPPKVGGGKGRNGSVILSWINPGYAYHAKTVIARNTNSYPQEPLNTNQIIGTINNPSTVEFTDVNTVNGTTYYYSIFVVDADGVYSDPEFVMFTPSGMAINIPPPPPSPPGLGGNILTPPSTTSQVPVAIPGTPPTFVAEKILNRDLSVGSRHEEVLLLQKSLQLLGHFPENENPTNYYGPLTARAVSGFQASQGLPSTGMLDDATRNVINNLSQSTLKSIAQQTIIEIKALNRTVSIGSRHEEVKTLQSILKNLGFFPDSEPITEYFGSITQRSLRRFQEANSISPADGTLRINSQDLLNRLVSLNPDLAQSPETVDIPQVSPILNTVTAQQGISTVATEFTKVLREGMSDPQVRLLQQVLRDEGVYPEGIVSGYFGALTRRALERFQEKYGIVSFGNPDTTGYGAVGSATQAKLNAILKGEVLSQQIESQSFIQERIQQLRAQIEQLNSFIERLKSQ